VEFFEYIESSKGIFLNTQQKKAVSHDKNPGLVLSTAGSGKTTVITARAGKLIYDKGLEQGRILTITFSKLAAEEMKSRFRRIFPEMDYRHTHFSTIHSFSYKIVRDYFSKMNKSINLMNSNFDALKKIMTSTYSKNGIYNVGVDEIENLSSKISYVKNMRIDREEYLSKNIGIRNFSEMFDAYESYKKENDMIDFDDMLIYCEKILSHYEKTSERFKSFYKYIQLDEAQDTSPLQYSIIDLISNGNIFMVGDDDQSIYSFRGSSNREMLDFKKKYYNGKIYNLDINYRCDGNVVELAKKFISLNKMRYKKSIESHNEKINEVVVKAFPTRRSQAEYIISKINEDPEAETAILYRYNISSLILAEKMRKSDIDFYIKEDRNKFFNSSVLRDISSFFKLAINPKDKESFSNIYYKCKTYFTKEMNLFVSKGKGTVYDSLYKYPNIDGLRLKNISGFKYDMNHILKLRPEQALEYIRFEMGYEEYLDRIEKDGRISFSSMFLDLEIIREICRNAGSLKEFIENLEYLKTLLKESKDKKHSNIMLSSIHSTKGLEFERVFMIDNIYGEFPMDNRNQSTKDYSDYYEEERRIFYVAMTRAKTQLHVLYPEAPSDFVNEVNGILKIKNSAKFSVGMNVSHPVFGKGKIVGAENEIIMFKDKNNKVYNLDKDLVLEKNLLAILK
jgi:DNA helicase-2/ATP-dependent DNA helicase PcrA